MQYEDKRAITLEEHQRILARERNLERAAFLRLLWHIGASQTDTARLTADCIDWNASTIAFSRCKTGVAVVIIPLTTLKKWLGHRRLETTAIYLDVGGDEERELAQRLW